MIKRDKSGYIGQHNADYPDYLDFGDCSSRTGLMALAGSELDRTLLPSFVKEKLICRHPTDEVWSDTSLTSRDQVLNWSCGFTLQAPDPVSKACLLNYATSWRINSDVLLPHHKLTLYRQARTRPPMLISALGTLIMLLTIVHNGLLFRSMEQNQIISMLAAFPASFSRLFMNLHGNISDNLINY